MKGGRHSGSLRSRDAALYGSAADEDSDRGLRPLPRAERGESPIRAVATATGHFRLPVQVVLNTLICDSEGRVIADTASGDWPESRRPKTGRGAGKWGAYGAAANAERLVELINAGAVAIGLVTQEEAKGADCGTL